MVSMGLEVSLMIFEYVEYVWWGIVGWYLGVWLGKLTLWFRRL